MPPHNRTAAGDAVRYQAVFDSAVEFAVITTDCDGLVTDWNPGAERILGLPEVW
ncbi:hypothetical protein BHAOGJBA_6130 [Methylobacterium hispanicum]|uniref:PAS domain-containing protein n=1 Tax=Methylobacterium hispanicum TaxID=270350 RepID=A0AAV4ZXJ0_9HYPH|nr:MULTISPECIES: PAS domain-containing protein [Methylobacterium]GJD92575.1 hypothetical protein BHAOGJBA_6130 [Methylobacterium hispanicum]